MHRLVVVGRVLNAGSGHNARRLSTDALPFTFNAAKRKSPDDSPPVSKAQDRKPNSGGDGTARNNARDSRYPASSGSPRRSRWVMSSQHESPGFAQRLAQRRMAQPSSADGAELDTQSASLPDIDSFPWDRRSKATVAESKVTEYFANPSPPRRDLGDNHTSEQQARRLKSAKRVPPKTPVKQETPKIATDIKLAEPSKSLKKVEEGKAFVGNDAPLINPSEPSIPKVHKPNTPSPQPTTRPFFAAIEETDFSKLFYPSSDRFSTTSTHTRSILENVGGDYSRHLPESLKKAQDNPTPLQRAQMTLARSKDVGLQSRNKISKVVDASLGGERGQIYK